MGLSRSCLAAGAACMRMFIPRAASPPCSPPSPHCPPLPNGERLSWHWHNALTWPKDVWHLSSPPCPTVLPQLRLCVSKLNFSPDGEIAVQGSGGGRGQHETAAPATGVGLRAALAPTQRKQRLRMPQVGFIWKPVVLLVLALLHLSYALPCQEFLFNALCCIPSGFYCP